MAFRINETDFFDGIRQNAVTRWDQLEADPELAAPWRQLFMQVQSPRHVLSELLQNADDAGATWAKASIENSTFLFEHDGEDFQPDHLRSLCRFGQSNKRQLHTIGFRGIGFKSTFSLGPRVEVYTPTLSFYFTEERFTQPNWEDYGLSPDSSVAVCVHILDENREEALRENFAEWLNNPASLLFFRNLQELWIGDDRIHRESKGPGPAQGTEWFNLTSNDNRHRVLLARSEAEEFPNDSIEEIRKERMNEEVVLPPASIDIVLGLQGDQKLYAVLPTDVRPALPFSCNAPFMQDPARSGIKDPSFSPTNDWLLERCGRLAAKVMVEWLKSDVMEISERSRAYKLMPKKDVAVNNIADKAAEIVSGGFGARFSEQANTVLTTEGTVNGPTEVIAIPKTLYGIWSDDDTCGLFGGQHKYLAAKEISETALLRLSEWQPIFIIRKRDGIKHVFDGTHNVPAPESKDGLLRLWAFFEPEIAKRRLLPYWKKLAIVPVTGGSFLSSANNVVRLKKDIASECAAEVVSGLLNIVDEEWITMVREGFQRASTMGNIDNNLIEMLSKANGVLAALGITEVTPVNEIVGKISSQTRYSRDTSDEHLIKITHLLAAMDAVIPDDFYYLCVDGKRRKPAEGVLYKTSAAGVDLLPGNWIAQHEIDPIYHQETGCCSVQIWNDWALSRKSALGTFVRPTAKVEKFYSQQGLVSYYKNHGCAEGPSLKITRHEYWINDYDFEPQFWNHWEKLAANDDQVWTRVLLEIIKDIGDIPVSLMQPKVYQYGTSKRHQLDHVDGLVTGWVNKLRSLPCIPDTYSTPQQPERLLLRNTSTEPLIGVEPFVHSDFDTAGTKLLLRALGVRDKPADVKSLLTRIRTAAYMPDIPLSDLIAWYRALDSIVAGLAAERMEELGIEKIFSEEKLIYAENKEWFRLDELFIEEDLDFPEEPVVNKSVSNLPLWSRLGVKRRPTMEHMLQRLESLAVDEKVDSDVSSRIRRWLAREPSVILERLNCWISVSDVWTSMEDLKWRYESDRKKARTELFPAVLSRTADLSMLNHASIPENALKLPSLENTLEHQVTNITRDGSPELVDWIKTIGDCLRLAELGENDPENDLVRAGEKMRATRVQLVRQVEVTPYLDNAPVGVARELSVFWSGKELYTKKKLGPENAENVINELLKWIDDDGIRRAIRFVSMRDSTFIREYFQSHFKMKSMDEVKADEKQLSNLDIIPDKEREVSSGAESPATSTSGSESGHYGQIEQDDNKPNREADLEESIEGLTIGIAGITKTQTWSGLTEDPAENGDQDVGMVDHCSSEFISEKGFEGNIEDLENVSSSGGGGLENEDPYRMQDKETQRNRNAPKIMGKKELFDTYMDMAGFSLNAERSIYSHPSGDRVQRSQDIFPYERVNSRMDVVTYFYVANEQLTKGISLPPDVYKYMEHEPQKVSILIRGDNDSPVLIMGDKLLKRIAAGEIGVFAESYRLVESVVVTN